MAQKQLLHQLLQEEQEPFLLKSYIGEFKRTSTSTKLKNLEIIKKPTQESPQKIYKGSCFFTFNCNSSVSPTKSPLFHYSPTLHIPEKTAALLLEAASRIYKPKRQSKSKNGFNLFGSLIKKLALSHKSLKTRNVNENIHQEMMMNMMLTNNNSGSCSVRSSSISSCSSALWSEEKSSDSDTFSSDSCSCWSCSCKEDMDFASYENNNNNNKHFCECPFHFALQRSPACSFTGRRMSEISSPFASPSRLDIKDKEEKLQEHDKAEEEDRDQFSPVSVLDPPFVDDHYDDDHCDFSSKIAQRTKQHLLQNASRFKTLVGLDPIKLENRIIEQEFDDEAGEEHVENDLIVRLVMQELEELSEMKSPGHLKRLILDLIEEEESGQTYREITDRVCKRFELWENVESDTIDMMVDQDFEIESGNWKSRNQEQLTEVGLVIERGIFGFLVDELVKELVCFLLQTN